MKKYGKKGIVLGVVILFVGMNMSFLVGAGTIGARISEPLSLNGSFLYVGGDGPGNYSTIQSAVDDAVDGDTVFVYSGIYHESVSVCKAVSLLGEDKNTTIIDGSSVEDRLCGVAYSGDVGIFYLVTISGFTIQGNTDEGGCGIRITYPTVQISGNIIKDNEKGIFLYFTEDNYICNNTITNNTYGIYIRFTSGISNVIRGEGAFHIIFCNDITDNQMGLFIFDTSHIVIEKNNFINNTRHASFNYFPIGRGPFGFITIIKPDRNSWHRNYWDDYNGSTGGFPKVIFGRTLGVFPMVNFDWDSAQEPYELL